jgi:hypothetical protein
VSPQLKSFEGPDVQVLLDQIRAELGPGAKINGAQKVRVGGVLGFFAKEHYRVVVETPGTTSDESPSEAVSEAGASSTDDRSSRRVRRNKAARADTGVEAESALSAQALPAQAVPAPMVPTDVFSAMAEATDDVNDVASVPPVSVPPLPVVPAPVPPVPVAQASGETAPTEEGAESFDAVLSRVATTLGADPADEAVSGHGHSNGNGNAGHGTGFAPEAGGPVPGDPVAGPPVGIASKAALFLAETVTGPAGPHQAVAAALRGTGLDPSVVAPVTEGLRHGAGLEALLLHALGGLPPAPAVPRRAGSLLVVVGAGSPARRLAAALAGEVGTDPTEVPFCSRDGGASALVTGRLLVRSAEDAAELAPGWRRSRPAVVVVDAAVTGSPRSWATHLIASLRPTAVWGVVESTAKTEDIHAWAEALGGIDALALENLEATVSPASALAVGIPVARIDGQPATAARWVAAIVDRVTPCM